MPLSRPFADTVRERVARDPAFAQALLDEHDAEIARLRAAQFDFARLSLDMAKLKVENARLKQALGLAP